jgi:hypothetical protein
MGGIGTMCVSAAAVLNKLLSRAWKLQAWSQDASQHQVKLDALAEKACSIESRMQSAGMYTEYFVDIVLKEPAPTLPKLHFQNYISKDLGGKQEILVRPKS